jgi:hypothetical protein
MPTILLVVCLIFATITIHVLAGERILVANQPLSISHLRLQHRIIDALLAHGHNVTELKWAISEQVRAQRRAHMRA